MPITTVANCRAFRNIKPDNSEHDAELRRLIPGVQAWLEEECGRVFDLAEVTEYFDGNQWRGRVMVARPPIVSIVNIWDDPARLYATPMSSSLYDAYDKQAGLIRLFNGAEFLRGERNIKVTYQGGFAKMPADLEQAAIEMVWAAREKGIQNLIGVRSRSIGDGAVQFVNLDWGSLNVAPIIAKYSLRRRAR